LMFYGVLWLVAVALTRLISGPSPQSL
jgi:hypothetical protein